MLNTISRMSALQLLCCFLICVYGNTVIEKSNPMECIIKIGDSKINLNVGLDILRKIGNVCTTYKCELDEVPSLKIIEEICPTDCDIGLELETNYTTCCPKCVQSKCLFDNKFYNVGESWNSLDGCSNMLCSKGDKGFEVLQFNKTCPAVKCLPEEKRIKHNCCYDCVSNDKSSDESFTLIETKNDPIVPENTDPMDKQYYAQHPCNRECIANEPLTCYYKFILEGYETVSKACYKCPSNQTDCLRPHCIMADGTPRSLVVVNRMMPGPQLEVCEGDNVIVDVDNQLSTESTTLHWHGLHMRDTPFMDGVPHVTQCPVPAHSQFRYLFNASQAGTHFWHSHIGVQRSDGVFGAIIVRKPKVYEQMHHLYDFDVSDHVILIQDWVHMPSEAHFTSHHHSNGTNKPLNILINGRGRMLARDSNTRRLTTSQPVVPSTEDTNDVETMIPMTSLNPSTDSSITPHPDVDDHQNPKTGPERMQLNSFNTPGIPFEVFEVLPKFSYRFRTINAEFLNCPVEVSIDNHTLIVFASDGHDFAPVQVESFVSYAGERFDFVVKADQPVGCYWIRFRGLLDCDQRFHSAHQVAILRYAGAPDVEPPYDTNYDYPLEGLQLNALNKGTGHVDSLSIAEMNSANPDNDRLLLPTTDYKFYIYYDFYRKDNPTFHVPKYYGFQAVNDTTRQLLTPQLNHISMMMPSQPLLLYRDSINESTFCNEDSLSAMGIDCNEEFCKCHHVLKVPLNSTVELIIVDEGYAFDANHPFHLHGYAFRVVGMEKLNKSISIEEVKRLDNAGMIKRKLNNAVIKDTVTIPDGGYTIIRFVADNPGFWLFHCHIEYHAEIGMALVMKVGENEDMVPTPKGFPTCDNYMPKYDFYAASSSTLFTWNLLLILLGLLTVFTQTERVIITCL